MALESLAARLARPAEATLSALWSMGEVLVAMRRPRDIWHDPYREPLFEDIARRGFYCEPEAAECPPPRADGWLVAPNPYRRLSSKAQPERVVAWLKHAGGPRRERLLVVCHPYGFPLPRLLERLFGLGRLGGFDVAYNIMNHHYWGSFAVWPGSGLSSPRLSWLIEGIRSAVVGLRFLIGALLERYGYRSVSLLGFSLGGHMVLHLANCLAAERMVAYCPVTDIQQTVRQLGLMPWLAPPLERLVRRLRPDFEPADLAVLEPLRYDLVTDPARLMVIVQRNDVMTPVHQIEAIRRKYPAVGWAEFEGTHLYPARRRRFNRLIRSWLEEGRA
jgi:hypothetical protein